MVVSHVVVSHVVVSQWHVGLFLFVPCDARGQIKAGITKTKNLEIVKIVKIVTV